MTEAITQILTQVANNNKKDDVSKQTLKPSMTLLHFWVNKPNVEWTCCTDFE